MRGIVKAAVLLGVVLAGLRAYGQADMEVQKGAPDPRLAARALGVNPDSTPPMTDEQLEYAREVGHDISCLCGTCPKEFVASCACPWAATSRRTIQAALAKGIPRERIVAAYRETYGDTVLAMLPDEGFARVAWVLPYIAGIIGLTIIAYVGLRALGRDRSGPRAPSSEAAGAEPISEARAELARELDEMD